MLIPYTTHSIVKFWFIIIAFSPFLNFVGIILSLYLTIKLRKYFQAKKKHLYILYGLIAIIGIGIGSRVFYYLGPWGTKYTLVQKTINIFNFAKPGMVYYGGFVFTIITIFLYTKIKKLNFKNYMNLIIITAPLGQFFGRIGCFLHGCCYGKTTKFTFFALQRLNSGRIIHASQIYLSLSALILFIINISLLKTRYKKLLFPIYLMLYSLTRFLIEFTRQYSWHFLQLSFSQLISIILFFTGMVIFFIWKKNDP